MIIITVGLMWGSDKHTKMQPIAQFFSAASLTLQ